MVLVNVFFNLAVICSFIGVASMITYAVSHHYNYPIAHASGALTVDSMKAGTFFALLAAFGLLFV